ncbi:MAG TPA: glycoside hydrolase family 2 TIM barrel-domain containing protein [Tepidisphaeraceae bacterium]|jgi:beta-galactosidase|nr:glycoside hydrolase family 2 TIM barrel-domain containing protein [Tepidisphaeraceae bacterium]
MVNQRFGLSAAAIICSMLLCSCVSTKSPAVSSKLENSATEGVVAPRVAVNLNSDWKFIRDDVPGAEQLGFDDSSWQNVKLPHTWNNLDGEDGGNNYYRGPAWYRRHLTLGADEHGKSLFLQFDAASSAATVYVNGKLAGPEHKGMFSAFCYDVTPLMNPDGDNVIAVRVTNAPDPSIPPISADFTFFGGLYRGVRLLALNPLSITPLDDASPGVYVKQVNISATHADLQVTSKLRNGGQALASANVTCELLDAGGAVVQTVNTQQAVDPGSETDSVQWISIDHPHLWNGRKDPYLYHVRVSVADGANVVDRVIQPVGIRFFSVDPDKGFFLNGQSYPLHGVNRHQDRLDMGWAITSREQKEDFNLIMEMGCNAIRLAHYQHAQEFYDLCDRGGLVVWAEACLVNVVNPSQAFADTAKQQLRELIKQSYNHPSICFWSLFNELRDKKEKTQTDAEGQAMLDSEIQLVKQLNDEAHQLDSTRLTTAASNIDNVKQELNQITDVIGFNRYLGWYTKSNADWPAELDSIHARIPNRAFCISEYGAGASVYQHEIDPAQPKTTGLWHPEEWQGVVHEAAYKAMKQRPYIWGTFLWNMFDFASDGRHEGDHLGRNDKGLVTYDRKIKKDAFYFYKANWSDEPVIYITDRRYTPRNVDKGPVKVYSNCDSVELKLNGTSLGSKTGDDCVFVWPDVTLIRGQNTIEATGTTRGGQSYSDTCTIDYDPGVVDVRPVKPTTAPSTMP